MSKAKSEVQTPEVVINTFKDAGYQSAKSGETMSKVAQFIVSKCPDFLNSYSDEVGKELKDGANRILDAQRKSFNEGGKFVEVDETIYALAGNVAPVTPTTVISSPSNDTSAQEALAVAATA